MLFRFLPFFIPFDHPFFCSVKGGGGWGGFFGDFGPPPLTPPTVGFYHPQKRARKTPSGSSFFCETHPLEMLVFLDHVSSLVFFSISPQKGSGFPHRPRPPLLSILPKKNTLRQSDWVPLRCALNPSRRFHFFQLRKIRKRQPYPPLLPPES